MSGLGTIANAAAIICGALAGIVLRRGLPEKWQQTIMQGVALCIVVIGLQMAFKTANIVIVVVSLVIGSIIGEYFDIEGNLQKFGSWIASKVYYGKDGSFAAQLYIIYAYFLHWCNGRCRSFAGWVKAGPYNFICQSNA